MLQLKNITKVYELGTMSINALNGVDLQFSKKKIAIRSYYEK